MVATEEELSEILTSEEAKTQEEVLPPEEESSPTGEAPFEEVRAEETSAAEAEEEAENIAPEAEGEKEAHEKYVISDKIPEEVGSEIEEGMEEKIETATAQEALFSVTPREETPEEKISEAMGEETSEETISTEPSVIQRKVLEEIEFDETAIKEKITDLLSEKLEKIINEALEQLDFEATIKEIAEERVSESLKELFPKIIYKTIDLALKNELEKIEKALSSRE